MTKSTNTLIKILDLIPKENRQLAEVLLVQLTQEIIREFKRESIKTFKEKYDESDNTSI